MIISIDWKSWLNKKRPNLSLKFNSSIETKLKDEKRRWLKPDNKIKRLTI